MGGRQWTIYLLSQGLNLHLYRSVAICRKATRALSLNMTFFVGVNPGTRSLGTDRQRTTFLFSETGEDMPHYAACNELRSYRNVHGHSSPSRWGDRGRQVFRVSPTEPQHKKCKLFGECHYLFERDAVSLPV